METLALTFFDWATGSMFFMVVPILAAVASVFVFVAGNPRYTWVPALALWGVIGGYVYCLVAQDDVHAEIAAKGESGALVLTQLRPTGNTINDQPEMEWVGTLKLSDGTLTPVSIATHSLRMWPEVDPYSPPLGKVLPVRYPISRPSLVVVTLPDAAAQQRCADVTRAIPELDAQILLLTGDAKAKAQANRDALTQEFMRCHAPK